MSRKAKLVHELKSLGAAMLFFGSWIGLLVFGKMLILAEYNISFAGFSVVFAGAMILSKVVLMMEHVSLGDWISRQPAWVDLVVRTALYGFGVLVVLVLENAFEARHEYGGFTGALANIPQQADIHHVAANAIGLTGALLTFNFFSLLRRRLPNGSISQILLQPPPQEQGVV